MYMVNRYFTHTDILLSQYLELSNTMKAMIEKIEKFNQSGIMEGKVEIQNMSCLKQQLLVQCDAKHASVLEGHVSFRKVM